MKRLQFSLILIAATFAGNINADVIHFVNGDQLQGKLLQVQDGNVIFQSDLAGKVTVDLQQLQSIETADPTQIHLNDGTILNSRVAPGQPGQLVLEGTDILQGQTISLSDLTAINPPPKPKPKWKGRLTAGFSSTHGNTFAESGFVSANAALRREKDRTNLYAAYLIARAEEGPDDVKVTTEESLVFGGQYDYFFTEKLYMFINGDFKKDHIADLDRRIIAGTGLGYQWIESDDMNFSTDVGLGYLCEQYTTHGQTTKSDELSAQFGYHFDKQLMEKLSFFHNLKYYPSVMSGFSDYFLRTDAELRLALTEKMFSSFKAIMDYDSTPGEGLTSTDTRYIIGIGWEF